MTSTNKPTNPRTKQPRNQQTSLTNIIVLLTISCLLTATAYAADFAGNLKSVSITDSAGANQPPSAVINYTHNGDTYTFDASGSSDPDGSIVEYKWDFGDGSTAVGVSVSHQFAAEGRYPVSVSTIDDKLGVSLTQVLIVIATPIKINFQPYYAAVPSGWSADMARDFDEKIGYGWIVPPPYDMGRDRGSDLSPDQTYDTVVPANSESVWGLNLPNGQYSVSICIGDPSYPESHQYLQVEGRPVFVDVGLPRDFPWETKQVDVVVQDGRLTLTFNNTNHYTQLNWIVVSPL